MTEEELTQRIRELVEANKKLEAEKKEIEDKLNKKILANKNLTIKIMKLKDEVRLLSDAINKTAPTNS